MEHKSPKRIWVIILLAFLVAGVIVGERWLKRTVLERSQRVMVGICGPGSRIGIEEVDYDLLPGDIRWTGLRIEQHQEPSDTLSDRAMRVSGTVDEISVHGFSLLRLLFSKTLSMRSLTIVHPRLEALMRTDTADLRPAERGVMMISALNADSLVVDDALLHIHRASDSTDMRTEALTLRITALRSRWPVNKPLEVHYATATGWLRGVQARLPPLYELRIADIVLGDDGRSLLVRDATLTALKGAQQYARFVHFETDLFDAHVDTAWVNGLDAAQLINASTLSATAMRVAGVDLNVFRDKTMPDAPFKHKPLPARLLRNSPVALCMDSLVLDRWDVVYHEKNTLTPDYGEVAFTDLHAAVRGLCSADTTKNDTLVIKATAQGFDRADVKFELRTVIADSRDRFTVKASIGRLPFGMFNRMTKDLILVRATAGTIGAVHLTMNADDDRATGRVDMEYSGLELEVLKADGSKKPRKFLSTLMNQVVRGENLRADQNFRHGDFAIERRKDRSSFNYLWSALREGMIVTLLPGVVDDLRPQQGR